MDRRLNKHRVFAVFPTGEINEFHAYSIGGRSQSARTYFERNVTSFEEMDSNALAIEGLKALKSSK